MFYMTTVRIAFRHPALTTCTDASQLFRWTDAAIALAESAGIQSILEKVRNLHDDDYELIRLCDLTLSLISDSKA